MKNSEREWETPEVRQATLVRVDEALHASDLFAVMQVLERGFDDPWQVAVKMNEETNEEEIKRRKIQLFKFWPKPALKAIWLRYVDDADQSADYPNVNAGWIAACIMDSEVQKFTENQVKKQLAKVEKMTGESIPPVQKQAQAY